jgi:hypothetical protein
MKSLVLGLLMSITLLIPVGTVMAGVPNFISYQGRLTTPSGTPVADGDYQITFAISDSPTSTDFWNSGPVNVSVSDGLFSVELGAPPMSSLPYQLWSYPALYLGITVGGDPEMTPRTGFGTTVYAFRSANADTAQLAKTVRIGDSTMIADNVGVSIGDATTPSEFTLLYVERNWNSPGDRRGQYLGVHNAGTGGLTGLQVSASTASGQPGNATGMTVSASGDGPTRTGLSVTAQSVSGMTGTSYGVLGSASLADNAYGVYGSVNSATNCYGIYGYANQQANSFAGYFDGHVSVTGTLSKAGGAFRIDHPLDPENKYLQHSFVESPDMMNIYNGVANLDGNGEVTVVLPEYFEALNRDFRYQLTAIGAPGPNLYIAEEISGNTFKIAGGGPRTKVSWQVTGVRKDAYAERNRIQVELDKQPDQKGMYLHPEAFDLPAERGVNYGHFKTGQETAERNNTEGR